MTKASFDDPTYEQKHFVFDVESIGLHGEAFAVAFLVFDEFQVFEEVCYACNRELARGDLSDHEWVAKNVPELPTNAASPEHVRELFWKKLRYWKKEGAHIWAQNTWPVDSGIVGACIQDDPVNRKFKGPCPIHEISTLTKFVLGNEWPGVLDSELPKHDPRNDARYSARVLKTALKKIEK